jgi:hypothetical protein
VTVTIECSKLSRSVTMESVSPAAALGCIGMFLLPFAAVGVGTAVNGLRHLAHGNWREGLMLTLFGLVFAIVAEPKSCFPQPGTPSWL